MWYLYLKTTSFYRYYKQLDYRQHNNLQYTFLPNSISLHFAFDRTELIPLNLQRNPEY